MHEEAKEAAKKLSEFMCRIEECFGTGIYGGALSKATVQDLPDLCDMIKDMAQAKKYCMEAAYYEKVIEAMEKSEKENEEWEKMGYNNRRYANGEYAPKGRGHVSGFNPIMREYPYINAYLNDGMENMEEMRMGYDNGSNSSSGSRGGNGRSGGSSSSNNGRSQSNSNSGRSGNSGRSVRMGYDGSYYDGQTFFEYDDARRHYGETGSDKDRDMMDEKGMKHVKDSIKTFKEIWEDADPMMRAELHKQLSAAVSEMKP